MNYIAHHGIKGQRWGIRRFQNEDGTLTDAGKNRYSKNLYKKLSRNAGMMSNDELYKKYGNHKLIKGIANNQERLKALKKLRDTKYDGPDEEYDSWEDPKVVKQALEEFERDMKKKYDPDNYQDYKLMTYYKDDIAEKTGAYKREEKLNRAPSWDKAYDEYTQATKKAIDAALGKMSSLKLKTLQSSSTDYQSVVEDLIWRIDNERLK